MCILQGQPMPIFASIFFGEFDCKVTTFSSFGQTFYNYKKTVQLHNILYFKHRNIKVQKRCIKLLQISKDLYFRYFINTVTKNRHQARHS